MIKKYTYTIYRPGGNDTALVEGIVKNPQLRRKINDAIMSKNPNVEQVGFVNNRGGNYRLQMAGGEFCANATRSTAFKYLQGKPGTLLMKVSGVSKILKAGVDRKGNAWAEMPVYPETDRITKGGDYYHRGNGRNNPSYC